MKHKINIAIDGLSSTGKSSLAKALAKELAYTYIDSGAMYRAVAYFFLENKVQISADNLSLDQELNKISLRFVEQRMRLNGIDIEDAIRTMRISNVVSEVAAIPAVRDFCVKQQQGFGTKKGVVMDGRDIGTVVFPDAELKIFLYASQAIRVLRRYDELKNKGSEVAKEEVEANLLHRDRIDSTREYNPLAKAEDAKELDNSQLDIPAQVSLIKNWIANLTH